MVIGQRCCLDSCKPVTMKKSVKSKRLDECRVVRACIIMHDDDDQLESKREKDGARNNNNIIIIYVCVCVCVCVCIITTGKQP